MEQKGLSEGSLFKLQKNDKSSVKCQVVINMLTRECSNEGGMLDKDG